MSTEAPSVDYSIDNGRNHDAIKKEVTEETATALQPSVVSEEDKITRKITVESAVTDTSVSSFSTPNTSSLWIDTNNQQIKLESTGDNTSTATESDSKAAAASTGNTTTVALNNEEKNNMNNGTNSSYTHQVTSGSVVPDLMELYDALTQSSTPQTDTVLPILEEGNHSSSSFQPSKDVHLFSDKRGKQLPVLPPISTSDTILPIEESFSVGTNALVHNKRSSSRKSQRSNSSDESYCESTGTGTKRKSNSSSIISTEVSKLRRPKINTSSANSKNFNVHLSSSNVSQNNSNINSDDFDCTRKKVKASTNVSGSDNRWSKRFTWPDELHRDFVAAIFDVGLKHSSPSSIMEQMRPNRDITSERVKSHLQKYRLNRQKSINEFMLSYNSALDRYRTRGTVEEDDVDYNMSCGEAAAFCTHSILNEMDRVEEASSHGATSDIPSREEQGGVPDGNAGPKDTAQDFNGVANLDMPLLTVEERDSPIGQAFGYLMGLFQMLSLQLEVIRNEQKIDASNPNAIPTTSSESGQRQHQPQQPLSSFQHYSQQSQTSYSQSLEQAAAKAASLHPSEPSIHELANVIPHVIVMGGSQGTHSTQLYPHAAGSIKPQDQIQNPNSYSNTAVLPPNFAPYFIPTLAQVKPTVPQEGHSSAVQHHYQAHPISARPSYPPYYVTTSSSLTQQQHHSLSMMEGDRVKKKNFVTHSNPSTNVSIVHGPLDSTVTTNSSGPRVVHPSASGPSSTTGTGRTLQAQKESSIMKQEMNSQKAFQNKMRALKQVELSKYGGRAKAASEKEISLQEDSYQSEEKQYSLVCGGGSGQVSEQALTENSQSHSPLLRHQNDEGLDQDFWNSADVNDQLFDFLMDA